MPTSFNRRLLLSLAAASKAAVLIVAITIGLFIAAKDSSIAFATFDPGYDVTLASTASSAPSNQTIQLDIDSGDYNFSAVIGFTPADAFIAPGPGSQAPNPAHSAATHPNLGDILGTLTSNTNLGLNNGACNTNLAVPFTFINATVDNTGGNEIPAIPQAATGPLGTLENMATDTGDAPGATPPWDDMTDDGTSGNGLPASVDRYPAYLNDLFNDVPPLQRIVGNTVVAGTQVSLNIVTFGPGDLAAGFSAPHPFADFDASMGYVGITVLQDTTVPGAPSSITDFCTVLNTTTVYYGEAHTNDCNGDTAAPCNTSTGISAPADNGVQGDDRYRNPPGSTHVWYGFMQSLRDLDGDGYENAFDTCPIPNDPVAGAHTPTYDYRTSAGPDGDGLDGQAGGPGAGLGCDPTPTVNTGAGNHDGDTAAGRAWNNGQDNCPRTTNGTQADTDGLITTPPSTAAPRGGPAGDGIGDACDPNVSTSNGQFTTALLEVAICIGGTDADGDGWCVTHGTDPDLNDPNDGDAAVTPERYERVAKMAIAHSGSGVNALVGGTNTALVGLGVAPHGDPGNTGSFSGAGMGQPYQACNDGLDNDADTTIDLLDTGCTPVGFLAAPDTDGDGYTDEAELHIGTDALGRCEVGAVPTTSTDWPSDLRSGAIPNSTDRINILDLATFVAPDRHLGTSPGAALFDQRWDLAPGRLPLAVWINILDLAAMTAPGADTGGPPMFGGARAFLGPLCTAHPTFQD